MSVKRPDLICDTDEVIDIVKKNLSKIIDYNCLLLAGSRIPEPYKDGWSGGKPRPDSDVDIIIIVDKRLERFKEMDMISYLNGYFRIEHNAYTCFAIRDSIPEHGVMKID